MDNEDIYWPAVIRSLCDGGGFAGRTPLDLELLTFDQIAVLCLSSEQIASGKRIVKLSVNDARNVGIIPPRKPGELMSKVQRVRAAKAGKVLAEREKSKADRRETRREIKRRKAEARKQG